MTTPEPEATESDDQRSDEVPPTSPAYSTPPPEGLPDAEHP